MILAGALLTVLAEPARAARDTESGFSIVVSEVRSITFNAESTFLTPTATELIRGWTQERMWDIEVSANAEWVLQVRGTESAWDGPWLKPVGDIYWSYEGSEYLPLDTTPVEVCMGGPADHKPCPVTFKVALDPLEDIPGEYRYRTIVFELSEP
jgi:hypothetical protein